MTTLSRQEKRFQVIIDEVTGDLFDAKYQSRLYWKINALVDDYSLNQSRAFWGVIIKSLQASAVLALARAYDQHKNGVHLVSFIDFISENTEIFSVENFKERLNENKHKDDLAKINRFPEKEQLLQDRTLVHKEDPLVKKLIQMRGNIIAHKNMGIATKDKKMPDALTWGEFNTLIERGFEIRNRYSNLYDASTYAQDSLIGKDDYQYVFNRLKAGDLACDFVNLKSFNLDSGNCLELTRQFIEEVRQEMYRRNIQ